MTQTTQNTKKDTIQYAFALVSLLFWGLVYMTFRTEKLMMFRVFDIIGLGETISKWRQSINISLPEWVIYNLPDALWATAYILVTDTIFRRGRDNTRLIAASIIPIIGILSELTQAAGIIPGTYDFLDIAAYMVPYTIFAIIIKTTKK